MTTSAPADEAVTSSAAAHEVSRTDHVEALMAARQYLEAKALLQQLIEERPQDGQIRHQLGKVCFELNETPSAIRHFEQAIALNPHDADSYYWLGAIKQRMGYIDAAEVAYDVAVKIRPLIPQRAIKTPPDFRVLALYAPFSGSTPTEYLFKDATYDIDTLAFFGPREPDISLLGDFDVVVNLISDADRAEARPPVWPRNSASLSSTIPTWSCAQRAMRLPTCCLVSLPAAFPGSCVWMPVPIFAPRRFRR